MKFSRDDYKSFLPRKYLTLTTRSRFEVEMINENLIITTPLNKFEIAIEKLEIIADIILFNKSLSAPFHWEDILDNKIHFYYLRVIAVELLYRKNRDLISFLSKRHIEDCINPSIINEDEEVLKPIIEMEQLFRKVTNQEQDAMSLMYNLNKETLHYEIISVFFATNREQTSDNKYFSSKNAYTITTGKLNISIPVLAHRPGKVETNSILGFRFFKEDPRKHFIIHEMEKLNNEKLIDSINKSEGSNKLIIFVHGFNVSFKDAAFKAAQIKYDLEIKHPMLLLSWPSYGSVKMYTHDVRATVSSAGILRNFITNLDSSSLDCEEIIFIAHSMGTFCLSQIIKGVSKNFKKLSRVVLAAADLPRIDFENDFATEYLNAFDGVALYVHSNDWALGISKKINSYELVGDSSNNVFTYNGIDTIETSNVSHDFFSLNHSYIFENGNLLEDMKKFLVSAIKPKNRGLKKINIINSLGYWELNP